MVGILAGTVEDALIALVFLPSTPYWYHYFIFYIFLKFSCLRHDWNCMLTFFAFSVMQPLVVIFHQMGLFLWWWVKLELRILFSSSSHRYSIVGKFGSFRWLKLFVSISATKQTTPDEVFKPEDGPVQSKSALQCQIHLYQAKQENFVQMFYFSVF